ncbi:hypothetical protein OHB14_58295 [Streptomyces sp. NBC_01613]|uniref:hypothetical protein n=1 Tax=Streptomyces sp. NBC_01613 TaxID=2975896 RepID=UPI00386D37A5
MLLRQSPEERRGPGVDASIVGELRETGIEAADRPVGDPVIRCHPLVVLACAEALAADPDEWHAAAGRGAGAASASTCVTVPA